MNTLRLLALASVLLLLHSCGVFRSYDNFDGKEFVSGKTILVSVIPGGKEDDVVNRFRAKGFKVLTRRANGVRPAMHEPETADGAGISSDGQAADFEVFVYADGMSADGTMTNLFSCLIFALPDRLRFYHLIFDGEGPGMTGFDDALDRVFADLGLQPPIASPPHPAPAPGTDR